MKKKKILKIIFVVVSAVAMLSVVLISTFASYGQLYDGFIFNINRVDEIIFKDDLGEWYNLPGTNLYLGPTTSGEGENSAWYYYPNHDISAHTYITDTTVHDYYIEEGQTYSSIQQIAYSYSDIQINPRDLYMDEANLGRGGSVEFESAMSGEQMVVQVDSAYSFYLADIDTLEYSLYIFRSTTYIYLEDDYYLEFDILTGSATNYEGEQTFVETDYELYNANNYQSISQGHVEHGFIYAYEECLNSVLGDYSLVYSIVGELGQSVNIFAPDNGIDNWEISNSRLANGYPILNNGNVYSGILAEVDVEVNFFDWLFQAVGSFLNMNVFGIPGVTYGTLIFFLLSIPLVIVFLRLFAGG